MPTTPRPAYPVAIWEEPPLPAAAFSFGAMTPYLLTDGSIVFLTRADTVPVGAIEASMVDSGSGYDEFVTPAVLTGRRVVETPRSLFFS